MLISYCMIVKNEIDTLEENLVRARPHVDEMIIVDTGSDDGSVEVAEKYADQVIEIEWPDSFSEARNVGLEEANGEYIMYLDGDEAIKKQQHWKNIRETLEESQPDAAAIQIENQLPDNQVLIGDRNWEVRIFKNHPVIRFEGRVHNQIVPSIKEYAGEEPHVERIHAVSEHVGYDYTPEELQEKYEERIPLLEREIEEAETEKWRSYYQYQLGNGYFMIGEYEKAHKEFIKANVDVLTEENQFSLHLMTCYSLLNLDRYEEADTHAHAMQELWPQEAIGMFMRGLTQLKLERFNGAFTLTLGAMQVANARNSLRYQVDEHYGAAIAGEAALNMEMYGRAKKLFNFHLEKYPDNEQVKNLEQRIIPKEEAADKPTRPPLETN